MSTVSSSTHYAGTPARIALMTAAAAAVLYVCLRVYASGQLAMALFMLLVGCLALWIYTSSRSGALRYLFPGIAAALVFVVFPMVFTMGLSFTNRSSTNLLDYEKALQNLREEVIVVADSQSAFELYSIVSTGALQYQLQLTTPQGKSWLSKPFSLNVGNDKQQTIALGEGAVQGMSPLSMREKMQFLPQLKLLRLQAADSGNYALISMREFAQLQPLYEQNADGSLTDKLTQKNYRANMQTGFFTGAEGDHLQPGYQVSVGWQHYVQMFTDNKFREPFVSVFIWTVTFAALSVLGAAALGLLLANILSWDRLRFRHTYRVILFLPYAVPGFLSILIFKGLFNQNLGEINLILNALFGIKPGWFSDPLLAKIMLLIVNIWLGFPYMMVLCAGLLQSIPADLREASSEAGAGPVTHFMRITLPLIIKPLLPLLIAAFAFNFNNFVLVSLLTGGRPDLPDVTLPAGTTDILVSYTWRIAFNDSGQQYGLAAAISTVIFLLVAAITLVQLRYTKINASAERKA